MRIQENIPLAPYTTFRIGGNAAFFCIASSIEDLREAREFARAKSIPTFVLGGGSNILVSDEGFPGLVIKNEIRGISFDENGSEVVVEAGAGESWDGFVEACVEKGLWGIENLSHIPGTVGAAPVQNIGAYGTEVRDTLVSVRVFDMDKGEERTISNGDCRFGYRDSVFKRDEHKDFVITGATFLLSKNPKPNLSYKDVKERFASEGAAEPDIREIRRTIIEIRKSKFPDLGSLGTAGSFWKNPVISAEAFSALKENYPAIPSYPAGEDKVKVPLAWILDSVCGLKGYAKGGISLFKNQPLVLTVSFGSSKAEVDAFAGEIEEIVFSKTGVRIEREVQTIA